MIQIKMQKLIALTIKHAYVGDAQDPIYVVLQLLLVLVLVLEILEYEYEYEYEYEMGHL